MEENNGKVTMKTLAKAAGVSVSTVSLALRNHSRIPEATKLKIRELARQLNYKPNPKLSRFMASLRDSNSQFMVNIGLVTPIVNPDRPELSRIFRGVHDRSRELGYGFDEFPIVRGVGTEKRLEEVLATRNMDGVVFFPMLGGKSSLNVRLTGLSAVAMGYSLVSPNLHRIAFDHFGGVTLAFQKLQEAGYARIGLCVRERANQSSRDAWLRGWYAHAWETGATNPPRPLIGSILDFREFETWFRKERPDVILADGNANNLLEWLDKMGVDVPGEAGYASLHLSHHWSGISGLKQNDYLQGRIAVDALAQSIYLNEQGIPENPRTIIVNGQWVDGATTRVQNNPA
jgi:LacI family transcriptional regulator